MKTLVIDPITDLLDNLESLLANTYEEKVAKRKITELSALDRTKWYAYRRDNTRKLLDQMINLDCDVVWVARSKDIWDKGSDGKMQPVGKTMDCLNILEYLVDVVIEMKKEKDSNRFYSIVTKSRAKTIREGTYENLSSFGELVDTKQATNKTGKEPVKFLPNAAKVSKITKSQINKLFELADKNTDVIKTAIEKFGYKKSSEILSDDFARIKTMLEIYGEYEVVDPAILNDITVDEVDNLIDNPEIKAEYIFKKVKHSNEAIETTQEDVEASEILEEAV